jgi:putative inorganic carbon (HCO3(-)) transporter
MLVFVVSTFMPSDAIGLVALAVVFLTFVKLLVKPGVQLQPDTSQLWLLAYFMFVVVSLAGSTLFSLSLHGFVKTFIYLTFYLSVTLYLKDNKNKISLLLAVIGLCAGFEAVAGLLQNFAHVSEISTWQDTTNLNPEEVMTRVYGTLKPLNPNLLGGYLVAAIPALFGLSAYLFSVRSIFSAKQKRCFLQIAAILLALISSAALVATGCRGAYLGFLVIVVGIFAVSAKYLWQNYKKIYLAVVGAAAAFTAAAIMAVGALRVRVLSIFAMRQDSSNSFRFNVYHSALDMFKDNWLLGIGVGNMNFREIYGLYMKTGFDALSAYNIFLEIAVESGIFALIAFVGFVVVLVKNAVGFIANSNDVKNVILVSTALVSVCALMVHGLVDTVFFRPQIQFIFWTMAAIIPTAARTE